MKNELQKMSRVINIPEFKYLDDLTAYEFNPDYCRLS